jgi:hypothetical protein
MRPYGFSTGAIAKGDFKRALALMEAVDVSAVELSALRLNEVQPLADAVSKLALTRYSFVSVHAPSKFPEAAETDIVRHMGYFASFGMHIVLHPDAIYTTKHWSILGESLCLENMDKRKPIGRTAAELENFFARFPNAGFCLDIGHARQVDPTMSETRSMLRDFGNKLREIHLSELTAGSKHERLSMATVFAIAPLAHLIPQHVPVIIESELDTSALERELVIARTAFGDTERLAATSAQ